MRLRWGVLVGLLTVLALAGGGSAAWATDGGSTSGGPTHTRSSGDGPTLVGVGEPGDTPFTQEQAEKFAKCMRANGIPDFETPKVTEPEGDKPGRIESTLPRDVDPETARKATEKCAEAGGLPKPVKPSAADVKKLKQYAKCIQENGIENFPTPEADGRLEFPEGIDPDSEEFQAAEKACQKYAPRHGKKTVHKGDGEKALHVA
ncbi:hypothetical protein [Cryptosporangium aurantiacum]|uniref:Uncharacterized protein n=1 Tax=Cryptosporangium aurantiacum TaxID=134849 RepID=A0A1M7NFC6_9ACTN|nr:hypothetical protein [Cryptosporangium aurantiacum]SHN01952.1 hypothetical protein SAMN05443668_102570 [Cryptosporangium aurantiacum]